MTDEIEDSVWKQTRRQVFQSEFREGVSKGRDEALQTGFDDGYKMGYELGQILGQNEGLKALRNDSNETLSMLLKKHNCLLCRNMAKDKSELPEAAYETPYEELKNSQSIANSKLKDEFKSSSPGVPD